MINFLTRIAFFIIGSLMLVDAALPNKVEKVFIDGHSTVTINDPTMHRPSIETHYKLEFKSGSVQSCDVGYSTYSQLKDGDPVELTTSKIFKRCTRIIHNGQSLLKEGISKLLIIIAGLAMIAGALGLVKISENNNFFGFGN